MTVSLSLASNFSLVSVTIKICSLQPKRWHPCIYSSSYAFMTHTSTSIQGSCVLLPKYYVHWLKEHSHVLESRHFFLVFLYLEHPQVLQVFTWDTSILHTCSIHIYNPAPHTCFPSEKISGHSLCFSILNPILTQYVLIRKPIQFPSNESHCSDLSVITRP